MKWVNPINIIIFNIIHREVSGDTVFMGKMENINSNKSILKKNIDFFAILFIRYREIQ